MKPFIRTTAVIAAFALASLSASAGPFGFQKGMTKEQVTNLLGKDMVRETVPDAGGGSIVIFNTAPTPVKDFTSYSVDFAKDAGVLKIVAATSPIVTESATALYDRYRDLRTVLTAKYGAPSRTHEPTSVDGIMKDMADNGRNVSSYWAANDNASFNGEIKSVMLKAVPISENTAILVVSYELTGFEDYQKQESSDRPNAF
ncbi:MAG TPA: hypothetical protein VKB38_24295 [Terracidiphilus sp.]|nr:hypothetical protein [Terracidiphilus sp.]